VTRSRIAALVLTLIFLLFITRWQLRRHHADTATSNSAGSLGKPDPQESADADADSHPTLVYAHNLMLRKGPDFRIYVSWIRGQMRRTRKQINPSFDDPESFVFEIQKGVIRANIGDISHFLNANTPSDAPLKNVTLQPDGNQIVLRGTVHKIIPLPVELRGTLAATNDGRVQYHLTKLEVLKLPLKGLLGKLHIQLNDLVKSGNMPGNYDRR
jgi:hypothetical protein